TYDQSVRRARKAPRRARVDDVPDIEQANSAAPVERRDQLGGAELGLGIFDRRLIRLYRGLLLGDHRLLSGDLLRGCEAFPFQRDIPAQINLRILQMGLVAREISLR